MFRAPATGITGTTPTPGVLRRIRAAGSPTPPAWTPEDVAGLTNWWDVDQGVTKDGSDRVSSWVDRVGSVDATQSTDSNKPVWTAGSLGNGDGLVFTAANNQVLTFPAISHGSVDHTIFSVFYRPVGTDNMVGLGNEHTSGAPYPILLYKTGWSWATWGNLSQGWSFAMAGVSPLVPVIVTMTWDSTTNVAVHRMNGVVQSSVKAGPYGGSPRPTNLDRIGQNNYPPDQRWANGTVGDLLWYHGTKLSAADILLVEQYLYEKFGFFGYNSRSFNGSGEYLTLANESNFDFEYDEAFSISIWAKTSSARSEAIFMKNPNGGTFRGIHLGRYTSIGGVILFQLYNDNGSNKKVGVKSTTDIGDGDWHHVVITKAAGVGSESEFKVYIDGVDETVVHQVSTLAGGTVLNNDPVIVGRRGTTGGAPFVYDWTGNLADLRVFNDELTAGEVEDLYNGGSHIESIEAWLPLSADLNDHSGNGNDGTATGTTQSSDGPFD